MKGALIGGGFTNGSYVSPRTGMIRTPTPTREKPNMQSKNLHQPPGVSEEHEVKLNRTRNKSREVAKELEGKHHKENVDENLVNLGLDVSSTEDEKSPVKRNVQQQHQKKKRKRPSLGFSNNDQNEVISHIRLKK